MSFGYDRYGNLLQQNVTLGSAPSFSAAANTNNQLVGYGYDASGNMTSDGSHTYQYDGESRLKSLDGGSSVNYTYDADNTRVVKQVGSDTAEYIVGNGQSLSEHHSANWNDWSDRVYLGGRLLAKADSYEDRILITGNTSGNQYSLFSFPSAGGYAGYVMRSGDKLFLRQWQSSGSHGGILVAFTDGSNTNWNVNDQDGQQINNDGTQGSWHYRRFDLSSYAGKTISQIYLVQEVSTTASPWSIYYTDISMVSLDGSVRPLYNRETSIALSHSGNSTGTASINHLSNSVLSPDTTTTFYHGDHLGSSRIMSSVNGYPVWQATYLPFGYEYNPQITVNHYKFTGKERDTESGLDEFGARYYGGAMGRFMTPDWAAKPTDVPYAHFGNPQSLNLYSYVQDNPTTVGDPDGHELGMCYGCGPAGQDVAPLDPGFPASTMSKQELQIDEGIISLASAVFTFGAVTDLAAGAEGGWGALKVASGVTSTAGSGVNATMQITGAITNTDTSSGTTGVNAVITVTGLTTTVVTGSFSKGAMASDLQNGASAITSPKEAAKDPAGTLSTAQGVVEAGENIINGVKSWFSPPPPPPPPPPPSPPPWVERAQ